MDHLGLFRRKLNFIWRHYALCAAPFEEIKRKIGAGEEPYAPPDTEEYEDEPLFLEEYLDADMSLNVVGQSCLGLLAQSLKEYLYGHTEVLICPWGTNERLEPTKAKGGWFNGFRELYAEHGLEWGDLPAALRVIEHMIYTRNDTLHFLNDWDMIRRQSPEHFEKHSDGIFVSEIYREMYKGSANSGPLPLAVTRQSLREAMDQVELFVRFVEGGCRAGAAPAFPRRLREASWPPEENGPASA